MRKRGALKSLAAPATAITLRLLKDFTSNSRVVRQTGAIVFATAANKGSSSPRITMLTRMISTSPQPGFHQAMKVWCQEVAGNPAFDEGV